MKHSPLRRYLTLLALSAKQDRGLDQEEALASFAQPATDEPDRDTPILAQHEPDRIAAQHTRLLESVNALEERLLEQSRPLDATSLQTENHQDPAPSTLLETPAPKPSAPPETPHVGRAMESPRQPHIPQSSLTRHQHAVARRRPRIPIRDSPRHSPYAVQQQPAMTSAHHRSARSIDAHRERRGAPPLSPTLLHYLSTLRPHKHEDHQSQTIQRKSIDPRSPARIHRLLTIERTLQRIEQLAIRAQIDGALPSQHAMLIEEDLIALRRKIKEKKEEYGL